MRISNSKKLAGGVAAALLLASAAIQANPNLVVNGGFEDGDFTGWTQFGDTNFTGVFDNSATIPPNPPLVQSGTYAASFGPVTPGGIFQTLVTLPGHFYDVSFGLQSEVDVNGQTGPNSFAFNWDGGTPEITLSNAPGFAYQDFSIRVLATSTTTDLRFAFTNVPAYWDLDNVAVTVPEPGSMALAGLGAAFVAVFNRRRRKV